MLFLTPLPQRLDSGATPTFAGILTGDGTAAAPSISFAADSDTGFYRTAANTLGFSSAGSLGMRFSGSAIYGATFDNYLFLDPNGTVAVVAAGSNRNITLTPSGTGFVTISGGTNNRLLLNTTTDSNALLQVGTNTTNSAGGMVFGTDTFLYRVGAAQLQIGTTTANLFFGAAGSMNYNGTDFILGTNTAAKGVILQSGASINALTLDSSQNATFAGTVIAPTGTTSLASIRIPHGAAPSSPTNGDVWSTTAGLFIRINGVTKSVNLT